MAYKLGKNGAGWSLLATGIIKQSLDDYVTFARTGSEKYIDVLDFFASDYFKHLCVYAEMDPDQVVRKIENTTVTDTARARALTWALSRGVEVPPIFTTRKKVAKVEKTLEDNSKLLFGKDTEAQRACMYGVRHAIEGLFPMALEYGRGSLNA